MQQVCIISQNSLAPPHRWLACSKQICPQTTEDQAGETLTKFVPDQLRVGDGPISSVVVVGADWFFPRIQRE